MSIQSKIVLGVVCLLLTASSLSAASLEIATAHDAFPATWSYVEVKARDLTSDVSGFQLSLVLEQHQYGLVRVEKGSDLVNCGWEYFSYRFIRDDSLPEFDLYDGTHLLELKGSASLSGGHVPGCNLSGQEVALARLKFLVDYEKTVGVGVGCSFQPVRFYWRDCRDNVLFTADGQKVLASNQVSDFAGGDPIQTDGLKPPTGDCSEHFGSMYAADMDALNGGLDVVCTDSLDIAAGDINLNARPMEIADVVLYNCYFLWGLGCFDIDVDRQLQQTDINGDGIIGSVADMVFMLRLIAHDVLPALRPSGELAQARIWTEQFADGQRIMAEFSEPSAGIYLKVKSNAGIASQLGFESGELEGMQTLLLVDSERGGIVLDEGYHVLAIVEGDVSVDEVQVVDQYATSFATKTEAPTLPQSFKLAQNYPNPFNPSTSISFYLPEAGAWTLSIHNITGRLVKQFEGQSRGEVTVDWHGDDRNNRTVGSGIYFYRLEANNQSQTKKMVLLK